VARELIRVLVVDDSALMRRLISKHLEADPALTVAGTARDGHEALRQVAQLRPDVVTLDVEMPGLDGLSTLQALMTQNPTPVVMLSSHTQQGARTTIRALMRGAVDFVAKPEEAQALPTVMTDLIEKIKNAAGSRPAALPMPSTAALPVPPSRLGLQPWQVGDRLVVIGASTGGPRALQALLPQLPGDLPAAVIVVQHMPATFTQSLAQRLNEATPLTVQEARAGDRLARGLVLVAPGDYHLRLGVRGQVLLDQGPRHNHLRPSVDVTMISAAQYGAAVLGVVLTGMGSDGTEGARHIRAAGGSVVAESEASAVVYGMPRSVVEAGLAAEVLPLGQIARVIEEWVRDGEPGV
jgi:two-component system chemotaxis response regulator CheB